MSFRPNKSLRVNGAVFTAFEDHCTACTARLKTTVLRLVDQIVCFSLAAGYMKFTSEQLTMSVTTSRCCGNYNTVLRARHGVVVLILRGLVAD
jgi:hypothetical protein